MLSRTWNYFVLACVISCGDPSSPVGNDRTVLPVLWRNTLSSSVNSYWLDGIPAFSDGKLFVEDGNTVTALDAATGEVRWKTPVRFNPVPGAYNVLAMNGRVVVSEVDSVTAMRASDGAVLWRFHTDSAAAPVWAAMDDRAVYTGQRTIPVVYAVGVSDGKLLWKVNIGPSWQFPGFVTGLSVSGDTVYAGGIHYLAQNGFIRTGVIVALDRLTGRELWRFETPETHDDSQGPPVISGRFLIMNDFYGGATIALDRFTGAELWRNKADPGGGFGPVAPGAISGDNLYIASEDAYMYRYSLSTGAVAWKQNTGTSMDGVALCGGAVLGMNGQIERRALEDGRLTGTGKSRIGKFTSNILAVNNVAYVTGMDGVYALDCQ